MIFHFGYDATPNLKKFAENLPKKAWEKLKRPPSCQVRTQCRHRPDNVKDDIVPGVVSTS